ncbi:hypothetical protein HK101_008775 [Irineochytrium annulatum]|nr:hypothetical protein HK101_008775 [Irineochytrium annulatum]
MSSTYKLQYWPIRALADVCRLILVRAGAEWEDVGVDKKDWAAMKEGMPRIKRMEVEEGERGKWASGKWKKDFTQSEKMGRILYTSTKALYLDPSLCFVPVNVANQLPVLTEFADGRQVLRLAQSKAIERYLARKHDLMGDNEHENAFLDSVLEALVDHENNWRKAKWAWKNGGKVKATEEERAVLAKEFVEGVVPSLRFLERALEENGRNGHFLRDKLTYVDLHAFFVIDDMLSVSPEAAEKALVGVPGLMKVYETVKADSVVGPYIASEKRRPLP